jgi:hypothetical protein
MGIGTALALAGCRVPVAGRVRQAGVVQTFLPYPDFVDALAVLDSPRLGKQRVETLQILRALVFPEYGWRNHPAVRMWRGRLPALVLYGLTSVAQWERRGFADTTAGQIAEFAPTVVGSTQADLAAAGLLPGWLGDDRLHRSHQSKLLSKNPEHYGRFFLDVPADLDYFWPDPDEVLPGDPMQGGPSLWVIRPASPHALGRFLQEGMISVGEGSGVEADATGRDLAGLRQLLSPSVRRTNRATAALARWVTEVKVGDDVAAQIQGGHALVVGEITSDYQFVQRTDEVGKHRRRTRWNRLIPRSAVEPMSALQDVRPLFRVVTSNDHPALDATNPGASGAPRIGFEHGT